MSAELLNLNKDNFPVDRYRPIKSLGRGALGEVFLCEDLTLRKTVAVKRLHALTDDRVVLFHREAKIASKMSHNHIIKVLDFGITESGSPFMVLEYFEGQSLESVIASRGKLDENLVLSMFFTICDALQYMHDNKIFHRDLKPANILVTTDGDQLIDLRIIDFGLSSIKEDWQTKTLIQGRTIVGTPVYMSPDTVKGEEYDARSEVYSVACLMFEALTGDVPFDGPTAVEILDQHIHKEPPTLQEVASGRKFSNGLQELMERCLAKDKSVRYQSMSELIAALKNIGYGRDDPAVPPPEFKSTSSGKWILIAGIAVILIAGIAVASVFVLFPDPVLKKNGAKSDDSPVFASENSEIKGDSPTLKDVDPALLSSPENMIDPNGYLQVKGPLFASNLKNLKKSYGQVRSLVLIRGTVTIEDVLALKGLQPEALDLFECKLKSKEVMKKLTELTSLKKFSIRRSKLRPDEIAPLVDMNVISIVLQDCNLTDEHIRPLKNLETRKLVLDYNPAITMATVKTLAPDYGSLVIWANTGPLSDLSKQEVNDIAKKYHVFLVNKKATMPAPTTIDKFD